MVKVHVWFMKSERPGGRVVTSKVGVGETAFKLTSESLLIKESF